MYEFKLPSSLTITNCDELLNSVIEAKHDNEKIHLDSSDVDTLDTAGIQLMYSLCSDQEQVSHDSASEKVKEVMTNLGISLI